MKLRRRFAVLFVLGAAQKVVRATMIELSQLEEMFANIKADAKWNMNEPMLWGYFFTDQSH